MFACEGYNWGLTALDRDAIVCDMTTSQDEKQVLRIIFPDELLTQLDEYCKSVEALYPGVNMSRSAAIRRMVEMALKEGVDSKDGYL